MLLDPQKLEPRVVARRPVKIRSVPPHTEQLEVSLGANGLSPGKMSLLVAKVEASAPPIVLQNAWIKLERRVL